MSDFVLDASLALQWFLKDETGRDYSLRVLNSLSKQSALVPVIWFYEVGNALLMAHRRKRLTQQDLEDFLNGLPKLALNVEPFVSTDTVRLTNLALQHGLTTYDAAYLDLSLEKRLPLATNDSALERAATKLGVPFLSV